MGIPNGYVSGQVIMAVPTKGNMKVDRFTTSGTFTPPTGVTYAIAHIRGGGGGTGNTTSPRGGTSSVAFASGTVTCEGGAGLDLPLINQNVSGITGGANSGFGGTGSGYHNSTTLSNAWGGNTNSGEIVAGADVTAGVGITVTIGAGGIGTGSGASTGGAGYVWIEYLV
jgi:hypothetical protein